MAFSGIFVGRDLVKDAQASITNTTAMTASIQYQRPGRTVRLMEFYTMLWTKKIFKSTLV